MEHGRDTDSPTRYPKCLCGELGIRSATYDALACPLTGVWLEVTCDSEGCSYCDNRPKVSTLPIS